MAVDLSEIVEAFRLVSRGNRLDRLSSGRTVSRHAATE